VPGKVSGEWWSEVVVACASWRGWKLGVGLLRVEPALVLVIPVELAGRQRVGYRGPEWAQEVTNMHRFWDATEQLRAGNRACVAHPGREIVVVQWREGMAWQEQGKQQACGINQTG